MKIAFYGSSLLSSYWNGAATYYRGILRALAERGYEITFYEPDAFDRQQHRDIDPPPWARSVVYPATAEALRGVLAEARRCRHRRQGQRRRRVRPRAARRHRRRRRDRDALRIFWDVDAAATLDEMRADPDPPGARRAAPARHGADLWRRPAGGRRLSRASARRACVPIYNALDPTTHLPVAPDERFACDLAFLANRLPDREARVEEFFLKPAAALPERRFLIGGNGWDDKAMPANVRHRRPCRHGRAQRLQLHAARRCSTSRATAWRNVGFSPATRVFEAAGAAACLITDAWEGIEQFLKPDDEVLVARDGQDVAEHLAALTPERARAIGQAALARVLAEHTYALRGAQVDALLAGACGTASERRHEARRPRPEPVLVLGQRPRHHLPRAARRRSPRAGTTSCSSSATCPGTRRSRDLADPDFCRSVFYAGLAELERWRGEIARADAVIVGSYVPDGVGGRPVRAGDGGAA